MQGIIELRYIGNRHLIAPECTSQTNKNTSIFNKFVHTVSVENQSVLM